VEKEVGRIEARRLPQVKVAEPTRDGRDLQATATMVAGVRSGEREEKGQVVLDWVGLTNLGPS
jgi:hypothetical protein